MESEGSNIVKFKEEKSNWSNEDYQNIFHCVKQFKTE